MVQLAPPSRPRTVGPSTSRKGLWDGRSVFLPFGASLVWFLRWVFRDGAWLWPRGLSRRDAGQGNAATLSLVSRLRRPDRVRGVRGRERVKGKWPGLAPAFPSLETGSWWICV
ncbi:uncharacterized protein LOC112626552 [Theropithecus gelada]|uniref:uncharacterized protein LOC112626552 n=1 Tax=Theropithecus gelada TaxID=9565 RepID=UPI000DC16128|nr:uncharacterized protein LOC112626552 [Theropithecus gelada]